MATEIVQLQSLLARAHGVAPPSTHPSNPVEAMESVLTCVQRIQ